MTSKRGRFFSRVIAIRRYHTRKARDRESGLCYASTPARNRASIHKRATFHILPALIGRRTTVEINVLH
ncbi:MAG: hypothetical protein KF868_04205 [Acidobacteria bacterium]|nr:hypothetical protein [Acidobacteriota bacterium]MCW5967649.1 hypothetical protein [Blastocatellales bacterium]